MSAIAIFDSCATRQGDTCNLGITEIHRLSTPLLLCSQCRGFDGSGGIKIQDSIFKIFFQ